MDQVAEKQSDIIPVEVLKRYMELNDLMSVLLALTRDKKSSKFTMIRYIKEINPKISGIVGVAQTKEKFYNDIEEYYLEYINQKSFRNTRYHAETLLELWEIIKVALMYHKVIDIGGN
jgi:hypothetical protein